MPMLRLFQGKKAKNLAVSAGWPKANPIGGRMLWQIAPGDDAIAGSLVADGDMVTARLTMNYMGKSIQMVSFGYDGKRDRYWSDGILFANDVDKACECFRLHTEPMRSVFHLASDDIAEEKAA